MNRLLMSLIGVLVVLAILASSMFVVDQRRFAIVFRFGEVQQVITEPGLYFKVPPPFAHVVTLDKRIQTIDNAEPDRFTTSEKKDLLVDSLIKWRISDPRQYFISFKGDAALAQDRLTQIAHAALTDEFARRSVADVVSHESDVVAAAEKKVATEASGIGVQVVDIRLKRVDLLSGISDSVYRRMAAEQQQAANQLRSQGAADAEKIRADADRQREVIVADAYRQAQTTMGEGDAQAASIYADAFGRDPQFYQFYKSLQVYREGFSKKSDLIVVDPNSELFRFFRGPEAASAAPAPTRRR
ncbi:MAG: protease modulator HflC [Janthinobacterium lividum]